MLKVKIDPKKKTATLIDDSESTPGVSRAIPAFREQVIPQIERILQKSNEGEAGWLNEIFGTTFTADDMEFSALTIVAQGPNPDGVILTFDYWGTGEETEPYKQKLDWKNIGQYILAFLIGGCVGAFFAFFG